MLSILTLSVVKRLREIGAKEMKEYDRAVRALSNDGEFDTKTAEFLCPSIKKRRRRAKACVRLIHRLQPKPSA